MFVTILVILECHAVVVIFIYFSHCLSMVVLRPFSSMSTGCVMPDWAIAFHTGWGKIFWNIPPWLAIGSGHGETRPWDTFILPLSYHNRLLQLYLYTIYCILYTVYCILYTVYCILYTVYYILYTVYYILYTVYCILYTVYCILYTIYYIVLIGRGRGSQLL